MISRLVLRITAPLIAVSLLLLGVGVFAAWFVHHQQQESMRLLAKSLESTEAAQEFENKVVEMDGELRQFARTGDAEYLIRAAGLHNEANQWLVQTEELVYSSETQSLVREIRRQYTFVINDIEQLRRMGREDLAVAAAARQIRPAALLRQARQQRALNEQRLIEATQNSQENANRAGQGFLILGACGAISGILAGFGIAFGIQKSIVELQVPIRSAAGAMDAVVGPIQVASGGSIESVREELDQLSSRVGTMVEQLQASQLEQLRSEQLAAMGQLAAGLAHEIRNPLTAMQTIVQTAREQGGAEAFDERDLSIIEEEIVRLNSTLQEFLDFARPPSLEKAATSILELVDRTMQLIAAKAASQGVSFKTSFEPDLPLMDVDPDQMRQVLLNVFINSLEAQPEGGEIEVTAEHARSPTGESKLRLCIADRGEGIQESIRDRLFEPFASSKEAGSGLGLSICNRIVGDHDGTIELENRVGGGTVTSILLPIRVSE